MGSRVAGSSQEAAEHFSCTTFCAVWTWRLWEEQLKLIARAGINAGVILLRPSLTIFEQMLSEVPRPGTPHFGAGRSLQI